MTNVQMRSGSVTQTVPPPVLFFSYANLAGLNLMLGTHPSPGPLMVNIVKMLPAPNRRFHAFGRVFSGTVKAGTEVRILLEVGTTQPVRIDTGRTTRTG
jgi:hypothetical protein